MDTTNENIRQLLEMLDNPDAYTEQEIRDIINHDEDTHETYRLMVAAKRSSRHRQDKTPVDVEAAWQRFCENEELKVKAQHNFPFPIFHFPFHKVAASFIGVLLVSGIALAAIWRLTPERPTSSPSREGMGEAGAMMTNGPDSLPSRGDLEGASVIYDNIPLEQMLPEIAAHYDVKVVFANDEVRGLRFRFVWNPQQGIDQVISDLNQFKHLTVTRKDNQITVE
ncbi:MAG: DUF4974 domain-containing protein [Bacteroidaceae bacterium]|nr:DUF4974 domain-containing protein [Bacteroidaceae bacterium]